MEANTRPVEAAKKEKAVVLLSGGLDSTTCLAAAIRAGYQVHTISFDYGQRHRVELDAAERIAGYYNIPHLVIAIDQDVLHGSALTGGGDVPKGRELKDIGCGIPSTWVPGRNLLFLANATCYAASIGASAIFIGVNSQDYSGYPDCRPAFIASFQHAVMCAIEPHALQIHTPLQWLNKAEIIKEATRLNAPLHLTHSCYSPIGDFACGECDSCLLRKKGFAEAGIIDPTKYANQL